MGIRCAGAPFGSALLCYCSASFGASSARCRSSVTRGVAVSGAKGRVVTVSVSLYGRVALVGRADPRRPAPPGRLPRHWPGAALFRLPVVYERTTTPTPAGRQNRNDPLPAGRLKLLEPNVWYPTVNPSRDPSGWCRNRSPCRDRSPTACRLGPHLHSRESEHGTFSTACASALFTWPGLPQMSIRYLLLAGRRSHR